MSSLPETKLPDSDPARSEPVYHDFEDAQAAKIDFDEPLYEVRSLRPLFDPRYRETRTLIYHGLCNTGSASLGALLGRPSLVRGKKVGISHRILRHEPDSLLPIPDCEFVHGHSAFGLHRYCTAPVTHVTMMRDPMTTFLSRYKLWCRELADPKQILPLEKYMEAFGYTVMAHDLSRCAGDGIASSSLTPEETLRRARHNLEHNFAFCGITERFEESIFLICDLLGWNQITMWKRHMATPGGLVPEDLSPRLLDRLRAMLANDQRLYDEQVERMDALLAQADFDSTLDLYKEAARNSEQTRRERTHEVWHVRLEQKLQALILDRDTQLEQQERQLGELQREVDQLRKLTVRQNEEIARRSRNELSLPSDSLVGSAARTTAHVVVLAMIPENWGGLASVVDALERHRSLRCTVVSLPTRLPLRGTPDFVDRMSELLRRRKIRFVAASDTSLAALDPDVVLTDVAEPTVYPAGWTLSDLQRHARVVFLPTEIELFADGLESFQFRRELHRSAWRILARSSGHAALQERELPGSSDRVRVVGRPHLDVYASPLPDDTLSRLLGQAIAPGQRSVLWHCSWANGDLVFDGERKRGWGTFFEMLPAMIEAVQTEPRLFVVCRPHPDLRITSIANGVVDAAFWSRFDEFVRRQPNFVVYEGSDDVLLMRACHALVSDVSGALLDFLPTRRPICCTYDPRSVALNEEGAIVSAFDRATHAEELRAFLASVLEGRDLRLEARDAMARLVLHAVDGRAGERIASVLARDLAVQAQPEEQMETAAR